MEVISKREKAEVIARLATDGLNITIDCFKEIVEETFQQYTNVNVVAIKFKSIEKAKSALKQVASGIKKDVNNAEIARTVIEQLYPESIGPRTKQATNFARYALLTLVRLAEAYKETEMTAMAVARDQLTSEELREQVIKLHNTYNMAVRWAEKYPKEFEKLKKEGRIDSIEQMTISLAREVATEERRAAEEETQIDYPTTRRRA